VRPEAHSVMADTSISNHNSQAQGIIPIARGVGGGWRSSQDDARSSDVSLIAKRVTSAAHSTGGSDNVDKTEFNIFGY
jgi:hypothetical protein